jgi:putative membrane protein
METTSAKTLRSRVLVFFKGMAMGVADSVPGVSGGTIAVMAGIYEELINSLKNLNPLALWEYKKRGLAGFWQSINGSFLLTLLLGIVTALYLSANTVLYLLETHYPQLMAFFCGLVLASTLFLRRQVLRWGLKEALFLLLGIVLTLLIAFVNPLAGQTGYVYLFLCGAIAICAMILPGISGAFILLLLGVYDYVLAALRALDVGIIVVFAAGCATGLLSFSHLLSWTFRYYREQTYAFLTGMLLASIVVLWPWKIMPDHGALGTSYLSPSAYAATTGSQVSVLSVAALFILGFALVTIFERISRSRA